ncbi:hypothetical protein JCM25156A_04040 [Komagataeibacter kakiaceti JCM 25156]
MYAGRSMVLKSGSSNPVLTWVWKPGRRVLAAVTFALACSARSLMPIESFPVGEVNALTVGAGGNGGNAMGASSDLHRGA